ncbi:hypothetical protein CHS0354_035126, partial [Potamilus streckersoni]
MENCPAFGTTVLDENNKSQPNGQGQHRRHWARTTHATQYISQTLCLIVNVTDVISNCVVEKVKHCCQKLRQKNMQVVVGRTT